MDSLGLNPAGVWLFRHRAERRPELPPKVPLQPAAPSTAPSTTWFLRGFFHAFEAACLVMSGIGVGLLHLSCGRQKATLGSFSGAGCFLLFFMGSKGDVKEFFGTFSGAGFWTVWA